MTLFFESDVVTVHWDASAQAVVLAWKKFPRSKGFKAGLEKGLELVKQKRATRWIGDVRQMKLLKPDDQRWVHEDWLPRLMAAGMKRMAVIIEPKALLAMSVEGAMQGSEEAGLVSLHVDNFEDAVAFVTQRKAA